MRTSRVSAKADFACKIRNYNKDAVCELLIFTDFASEVRPLVATRQLSCYSPLTMAIQAEVTKSGNENPLSTIRKFSRRVQGAGLVKTLRARRYYSRQASKTVKKKRALKLLKRRSEYRRLLKEGKIAEPTRRYQPREPISRPSSALGEGTPIAR